MTYPLPKWEQAFNDWKSLLKAAKAENLLNDPTAVWDEAWRQASMVAQSTMQQHATPKVIRVLNEQFKRKLFS